MLKTRIGMTDGVDTDLMGKKVWSWVQAGGLYEDRPPFAMPYSRSFNHFHDPLSNVGYLGLWNSSVIWGQLPRTTQSQGGWYSWHDARSYFYQALTRKSNREKEEQWAKTFRALGQLMHLVQDASVPSHARNDGHPSGFDYEYWLKKHPEFLRHFTSPVSFDRSVLFSETNRPGMYPITPLFDTNTYNGFNPLATLSPTVGLTEFTNANFFSEDTIFRGYPHPAVEDTTYGDINWANPEMTDAEDRIKDNVIYIRDKKNGYRLAAMGYFSYDVKRKLSSGEQVDKGYEFLPLVLYDDIYRDYASHLIPRAVGYSADLLDYFFRGNIYIGPTDKGVFSFIHYDDDPGKGFQKLTLSALSITSSGEEMRDGSIELVVKFKRALEYPFRVRTSSVPVTEEFEYKVYPEAQGIRSIPRTEFVTLEFDLSSDPIPLEAVDLSIQIVYKGRLGAESEAVVVGFSNIGEPTPFDVYNSMDRFCLNSTWYIAGSDAILQQTDPLGRPITMTADVFSHDLKDIYVRFSFYWTPKACFTDRLPVSHSSAQGGRVQACLSADRVLFHRQSLSVQDRAHRS